MQSVKCGVEDKNLADFLILFYCIIKSVNFKTIPRRGRCPHRPEPLPNRGKTGAKPIHISNN